MRRCARAFWRRIRRLRSAPSSSRRFTPSSATRSPRAALAAGAAEADYVASHGLTLAHDGDAHHTLQIGDPFRIREVTGRTVVYDFRSADTAAGGTGAPLVPYVDALLLAHATETRVALNLGGIANLSVLPPNAAPDDVFAFDCGPANLPIDTYVEARTAGEVRFDRAGAFARAGAADEALLTSVARGSVLCAPAAEDDRTRTFRRTVRRAASRGARCAPVSRRGADADRTCDPQYRGGDSRVRAGGRADDRERRRRPQPDDPRRPARGAPRAPSRPRMPTASTSTPRRRSRSRCSATKRCASSRPDCRT